MKPCYGLNLSLTRGMRVGLFGGSFDPPHFGHVMLAKNALKALKLDRILWVVSQQNPLKTRQPADFKSRKQAILSLVKHPKFIISSIEQDFNIQYSINMVMLLVKRYPSIDFTFLTGADNIATMDKWKDWQKILNSCDWAVISRPHQGFHILRQKAFQIPSKKQKTYLYFPYQDISSTQLRNKDII